MTLSFKPTRAGGSHVCMCSTSTCHVTHLSFIQQRIYSILSSYWVLVCTVLMHMQGLQQERQSSEELCNVTRQLAKVLLQVSKAS